jgi:transcription initiation factor IIE alpha subunit
LPFNIKFFCSLLEVAEAEVQQAQSSSSQYIQRVWTCPACQQKMAVTLAEQLQHQAECKKHLEEMEAAARGASQQAGPSSEALLKEYHCKDCDEVLRLTTIDILKHKCMHAKQKQS